MSAAVTTAPAATPATDPERVRPRRSFLLGLCGLLAIWVLAVPPFAGSDEHDHAYRAAAAARGEWAIDPVDATRGTGAFLDVPTDIVRAARSQCEALRYTGPSDCVGKPHGNDRVVSSGAGRYHPLFYAIVGSAALPFHGATALYAMRIATALLAALFAGLAVAAAATWSRTRWPYLGIAVACTPVALYSSSIVAPNGVEMMSAMALWMSLIGLLLAPAYQSTRLALVAGISGATLATLRPLGPLWCLLVLVGVLVAVRPEAGRVAWLLRRPAVLAGAGLVLVSALQSVAWVVTAHALKLGVEAPIHTTLGYRLGITATQLPAWILQAIAAFPLRKDPSHPAVYACYLILFGVVVVLGLRAGRPRVALAIGLVAAGALLFPYFSTVESFDQYRAAWQGRYGLPLSMGLVLLAVMALDRAGWRLGGPVRLLLLLLFVVAQTLSVTYLLNLEVRTSPQSGTASWVQPSLLLTVVWAGASSALMWWGACAQGRTADGQQRVAS